MVVKYSGKKYNKDEKIIDYSEFNILTHKELFASVSDLAFIDISAIKNKKVDADHKHACSKVFNLVKTCILDSDLKDFIF